MIAIPWREICFIFFFGALAETLAMCVRPPHVIFCKPLAARSRRSQWTAIIRSLCTAVDRLMAGKRADRGAGGHRNLDAALATLQRPCGGRLNRLNPLGSCGWRVFWVLLGYLEESLD